ncbi:neuroblast differentiation-associated protein AHNAK [Cyprinodon tularosa]|uniref:neuroblast differentiation-associated protein AHNAK n=1 Tax=Cyprinodon tularosa TaxID=77115 RepID=UPI0018E1E86D|nr:neuroblast differentiation-associated protein AHNAK [Cyprinodon tularosa]
MCECLRGIFRVTWAPSSSTDSDADQEDSHVRSQTRAQAVKDKRRSPPSTRSPSAPQRNPPHSSTVDEQESPERVVQKEKLHAELKQVLSQKRSHLRESTCKLAQPEMDTEPGEEQTCIEEVSKSVEIVVETEAEAGASGYSVTGGGEDGIFVKDVLKDSPAAKHLSLQQGDQLLSAKVYFDNVRYEDALKILQCAEPYKVSFQVKRTIPTTEDGVRPRVPSGEVKLPKAKVAKMSVKGVKSFKTQKKRGGRFGLKRLKEKRKEELVIEGTPPRLEPGEVDVEFSLPKIKQRKNTKTDVDVRGTGNMAKTKRRIRFPHMKAKAYSGAGGQLEVEGHENIPPSEIPAAKVKTKGKGHKFGIMFPKTKHSKSGLSSESGSVEVSPKEINIKPKSVEISLSGKEQNTLEKRGSKFSPPDVEFVLPTGKAEASLATVKGTTEIKAPKVDIKGDADVPQGKVNIDVSKEDSKLRMPNIKLPKMQLPRLSDEVDGEKKIKEIKIPQADIDMPKAKVGCGGEISLPDVEVTKPKIKGDISGKAASAQIPSVDISMPNLKGKSDASYSLQGLEGEGKSAIKMPAINISVPDAGLEFDSRQRIPDEVVGTVRVPQISGPKVDIVPKIRTSGVDIKGSEGGVKVSPPSVDASLPKMKSDFVDVDMDHFVGGGGKFKLPEFDVTPPEKKLPEEGGGFKLPKVDLTLPNLNPVVTDHEGKDKFQLPSVVISLPQLKAGEVEVNTEHKTVKGGKFEMHVKPIPEGKIEGDINAKGHLEGANFKMPSIDVSLPNLKPEGQVTVPMFEVEGESLLPSVNISMPKGNAEGGFEIGSRDVKGIQLKEISLPASAEQGNIELEGSGSTKFKMPNFDIVLPKGKNEGREEDTETAVKGGAKIHMPSLDISPPTQKTPKGMKDMSIEVPEINIKLPKAKLDLKGTDIKEDSKKFPTKDISLPKDRIEASVHVEEKGKLKMPSFDVSIPKVKMAEENIDIGGQSVDIVLPKGKLDVDKGAKSKGHFHLPSVDLSLPKIQSKRNDVNIKVPELGSGEVKAPTVDISLPKGTFEGDIDFENEAKGVGFNVPSVDTDSSAEIPKGDVNFQGPKVKRDKFEMPRIDISFPKGKKHGDIDIDINSGIDGKIEIPSCDTKLPKGKGKSGLTDKDLDGKSGKLRMPKFKVSVPKLDAPEGDLKLHGTDVKGKVEMPAVDISTPKGKVEGDFDIENHAAKGAKFHMPSLNINLPKIKSKDAKINVKSHEGEGQTFELSSMDISAPKIKSPEADVSLKGPDLDISVTGPKDDVEIVKDPEIKGRKTKVPTFDISMPRVNFPEGEVKLKGADFKSKKIEMPDIDISLPKGKSDSEIDGHGWKGGKFQMPSVDFSLPKIKAKGPEVNIEGPEIKQGDINMPDIDLSLPEGKNDEVKGEFKMPKFDISFPKTNLPEGHVDESKVNISLTKQKGDVDGHIGKEGNFQLPSIDVSLPKIKANKSKSDFEGPELKSDVTIPKGKIEGDPSFRGPGVKEEYKLPTLEASIYRGKADVDFEVEDSEIISGMVKMPKFDVSLPKVSLPEGNSKINEPSINVGKIEMPDIDISIPKGKTKGEIETKGHASEGSKFQIPSVDFSLPKIKVNVSEPSVKNPDVQGVKMNMPSPDASMPKFESPDLEVSLHRPDMDVDLSTPSLKKDGDVNIEEMDIKGRKFKMPKFDVSLPKMGLPKVDTNIGPEMKEKTKITADFSLPKAKGPEINVEGHETTGGEIHLPTCDVSLPKTNPLNIEATLKAPGLKGGKIKTPAVDISLPGGTTDGDLNVEAPEFKSGKYKMPKFDISLPKVTLPKADVRVEGPDIKDDMEMPTAEISLPEFKTDLEIDVGSGKSKFHMPSIDISFPTVKVKEADIDMQGPKIKGEMPLSSDMDITIKGPELQEDTFDPPNLDVSLPKGKADGDTSAEVKGGKFKMPKFDISLPKINLSKVEVRAEGPDMKGKLEKPTTDVSCQKAKKSVDVHVETGKGGKFHMPMVDFSLPNVKAKGGDIKGDLSLSNVKSPEVDVSLISYPKDKPEGGCEVEGPEVRGGKLKQPEIESESDLKIKGSDLKTRKIELPDIDLSLPKVKVEGGSETEEYSVKGGKFHMPNIDFSLPKMKKKETEINIEGPEFKGGKLNIPKTNFSLPNEKIDADLSVEGPEIKGGKGTMPKVDISFQELSLPEAGLKVEGSEFKGKPEIPGADISIIKEKLKGDIDIEGQSGKKPKFQLPSVDISFPKIKTKEADVAIEVPEPEVENSLQGVQLEVDLNVKQPKVKESKPKMAKVNLPEGEFKMKGPKVKGGNSEILDMNISLPRGKIGEEHEIGLPSSKEGKFKMPSVDINHLKIKVKGPDLNVESPDIEGGKINMPDGDVCLSKGKIESEFDVETSEIKGGKFKLPKFDISLPKASFPKTDASVEGPDVKAQVEIPEADISLPEAKTNVEIDVNTGTSSKFHMPSVYIALPKVKAKGDIDIQQPKIKGDFSHPKAELPEVDVSLNSPEVGGKINLPTVDISPSKGRVDGGLEFEGVEGKLKKPNIDMTLPKVTLPEGNLKIQGPKIKAGTIEMPDLDISIPNPKAEGKFDTEGHVKKGGKFHLPFIHLPDMKAKEPQANIKCPEADVDIKAPDTKGGKGGRFHMPTLDVNMPKFDLDLSLPSVSKPSGPKGEVSGPDTSADLEMLNLKGDLKPEQMRVKTLDVEGSAASVKLPSVKLPTVDISAPKVDLDFGLNKPKGDDVKVELLKAEGGRPSSGGSFDIPDVSLKVPSFTLPRFGAKSNSSNLEVSGQKDVSLHQPNVEGEIRAPSVEFDRDGKVKVKKPKIKMPSFGISKKDTDVSVSCPDVDVKVQKGKPELPHHDFRTEGPDHKVKHKLKFPKFKMSSPKVQLSEGEVEAEVGRKNGFYGPDVTLQLPKFSMPGFGSKERNLDKPSGELQTQPKVKMPSVELSLPEAKTQEMEVLLPKAEVDVSEADIEGYEGNLKIPKMDVTIPKVDLDVSLPKGKSSKNDGLDVELKGDEGKFKMPQITMPSLNVTLPKGKLKSPSNPKTEMGDNGGQFTLPYVKMPNIDITVPKADISLPKVKPEISETNMKGNTEQKSKMPKVDISLPKSKLQNDEAQEKNEETGKIKMPHIKMPHVDISLPKVKTESQDVEIRGEEGKLEMPQVNIPSVDLSLPKAKAKGPNVQVVGSSEQTFKLPYSKMPDIDVSLHKGQLKGPNVEIEGEKGTFKMPHISMPSLEISLPKRKVESIDIEASGGEVKTPNVKMPSADISGIKGEIEDQDTEITGNVGGKLKRSPLKMPHVEFSEPKGKGVPDVGISMPSVDLSLPKGEFKSPGAGIGGTEGKINMPHLKMPNVDISLPKGNSGKSEGTEFKAEGHIPEVPTGDISLQKCETTGPISGTKNGGGKFKMPKVDISLPKGKLSVEGPEVDIQKGQVNMPKASADKPSGKKEAEEGTIKLPHIKMPKVDLSFSKSKGTEVPTMETEVKGRDAELPKEKMSLQNDNLTKEAKPDLKADLHVEGEQKGLKLNLPTTDIKSSKEEAEVNIGLQRVEGKTDKKKIISPDLDLNASGSQSKNNGGKVKGPKFKIGMPKMKGDKDVKLEKEQCKDDVEQNSHKTDNGQINITAPEVVLPSISFKTDSDSKGGPSSSSKEIKVPRIPDIEFDIGTSQDEDDETEMEKKVKIPKFGVPLPSISSPERHMDFYGSEIFYDGPKKPKVKKAVFVMVNPNETEKVAANISFPKKETAAENDTEDVTMKITKTKTKPNSGKSKEKSSEREAEEEEKLKGAKIKMPKFSFSSGKSGSADVPTKGDGSSSSLNGEKDASPYKDSKDDKGAFGGKIKLPKVVFTSPYSKMTTGDKIEKDLSSEVVKGDINTFETTSKMSSKEVVSSHARTEMLDRDSSESPVVLGAESTSTNVQMWSEVEAEEKESTSWFKIPKFTLKPHATGFLQITPEGSPKAQHRGELGGEAEVSGLFSLHTLEFDYTSQPMSEEHNVSSTVEETVTTVTKTTRITNLVTTETRACEASTTQQVSDFKY